MTAMEKLQARIATSQSLVCVGLDAAIDKLPEQFRTAPEPQLAFNKWIIDQTHQHALAYKPNPAFYESRGEQGVAELKKTIEYIRSEHPDIFIIYDGKRADIGSTNEGYATSAFDELGCDAITLHPYLGQEALQPFLERKDKVSIILCRTSNPGAGEFQDLAVEGQPLWQRVARQVAQNWNTHNNCMLVVGGTYPAEMAQIRHEVGDMTLLVPGVGAQGGDLQMVMNAGMNAQKTGVIINSSRGIIFAADPGSEAAKLKAEINKLRGV